MSLYSLKYATCNEHAPYFHLWPVQLYDFFTYPTKCTIKKKLLNVKRVVRFSVQILSEIFVILKRSERDIIKKVYWSRCKVPLFLSDFNGI